MDRDPDDTTMMNSRGAPQHWHTPLHGAPLFISAILIIVLLEIVLLVWMSMENPRTRLCKLIGARKLER